MKLMKHIMIALVLCAIPAMAFGQTTVNCDVCTHEVSVYMGKGGLIATADDVDEVSYLAHCGGVTRTGTLDADDDGVVRTAFDADSMLQCDMADEDNKFEIGPVMDGGWYWIIDGGNAAVGNLVNMDVLENDTVDVTDPGDGVEMMEGRGAVYLKETATGLVGILPNILPEPPATAANRCGYTDRGRSADTTTFKRYTRVTNGCMLGDGGTKLLATTTNSFTGATTEVMNGGTVVRPSGAGQVVVTADLWGNNSGHFTTDPTADLTTGTGVSARLGHQSAVAAGARTERYTGVTYTAKLGTGPTAADLVSGTEDGGVTMSTDTTDIVTFTIIADSDHCNATPPRNHSVVVAVTAVMPAANPGTPAGTAAQVTPYIGRHAASGAVGSTSFTIVCGTGSSATTGQELVPDNPFPVN